MSEKQEMPLNFTNRENLMLRRTEDGEFTTIKIDIDKGKEQLSIVKLEDSSEFGLRLHVYPNPEVDEPITVPLYSYRGVSSLNLSETERAKAEEMLLDAWLHMDDNTEQDLTRHIFMNGTTGIHNLSEYELMTSLGFDDVREFKKELS